MNKSPESFAQVGKLVDIDFEGLRFSIELQAGIDRYISVDIERDKVWEPFETRVFKALCRSSSTVIDIGANIGWYSLVASSCVGPDGLILALEPEPHNFSLLRRNLARNRVGNVIARQVAVTDKTGSGSLFLSRENMGDHRLIDGGESRSATPVELVRLDDLIQTMGRSPTLVKSDTQGSEWNIVQGVGPGSLDPKLCCWLVEFWPHGLAGMNAEPSGLLDWFFSRGYRFYELSEANPRLVETNPEKLLHRANTDLSKESLGFINLLLIHPADSRIAEISKFIN